jgi:putative phosphoesterase
VFRREQVDQVLCAGDIAGYGTQLAETIELLDKAGSACVVGNHDLWYLAHHRGEDLIADAYLEALPGALEFNIEGCSVYLVHAHPPAANRGGIKLRNKAGELDAAAVTACAAQLAGFGRQLLIVGHTHQVYAEQFGPTLLINPGSCTFNHSCAVITLPECRIEWFPLGGKLISPIWNWGQYELADD